MKNYKLIEGNSVAYRENVAILEAKQLLREGAISDWFGKAFGSISNKVLVVDWAKAEQHLGSPIPDEIKRRVEDYLGSKTFMVYRYKALAVALGGIGLIGTIFTSIIFGTNGLTATVPMIGVSLFISCFELFLMYYFAKRKFSKDVLEAFKSKIESADPITRQRIINNQRKKTWDAIMSNFETTDVDGSHPTLSSVAWLLIIFQILGVFVSIATGGAN